MLVIFLLGIGLTQPSGFMQRCDVRTMYHHCSVEDHDITPLDFIFEHFLNLESIVNIIEGEQEYPSGDHPHNPFQTSQAISLITFVTPALLQFDVSGRCLFPYKKLVYFAGSSDGYSSRFHADILRPPIQS